MAVTTPTPAPTTGAPVPAAPPSAPLVVGEKAAARRALADTGERSVISAADRKRPVVRRSLFTVQTVILIGLVVSGLGPLLWLLKASFSTAQDILRHPLGLFPSGIQWGTLWHTWTEARIGHYLGTTAIVAGGQLVITLVVCITIAYVLSVLRPKWGPVISGGILATLFVPATIILVPLYLSIVHVPLTGGASLINNYLAVWLPGAANAFNILVVKRFFDALPRDLFEAARIDGAGPYRVLWTVVLPLSRPIIGVVALLTVMASWKDFLWPLLVLQNPDLQPISVALPQITKASSLNVQMAALFLALIVPVILFLVFQRQFLRGVSLSGGVKG
jgi:multiple sugar transport system permease protein